MASVRSTRNATTEIALTKLFRKLKLKGWRRFYRLRGKPDFVFPKEKTIVFADGCFWHGHNCRNTTPKDNRVYWRNKILRNKTRDRRVAACLRRQGWHVFRVWECRIAKGDLPKSLIKLLETKKTTARRRG